jgi:pyrroloquinoline-quinone synthase
MAKRKSPFRRALEDAVLERHCAHHPMTQKWVKGELGRKALMGWAVEHYHWVNDFLATNFMICAKAPRDVVEHELENFMEETDDKRPHIEIVLKFAKANGANLDRVRKSRGLPTTRSWRNWLINCAKYEHWIAAIAALRIGTESQSPLLYRTVLPALRKHYKFKEDDIEHFWLHVEADTDHGDAGFEILERHCKTRELKDMAVAFARESAQMRWFYFDGIYLHYEMGHSLSADRNRY